jgi:hypothetical protein
LMKVICNHKNMMIQEFQQTTEWQSIELMTDWIPLTRFESIPTVIQLRTIQLLCILESLWLWTLELTMESTPEANYFLVHLESRLSLYNLLWRSFVEWKAIWHDL